jgi:hypothetical protein
MEYSAFEAVALRLGGGHISKLRDAARPLQLGEINMEWYIWSEARD